MLLKYHKTISSDIGPDLNMQAKGTEWDGWGDDGGDPEAYWYARLGINMN